jgi:predicted TIM-barrel fold metal-dependent hydrolase
MDTFPFVDAHVHLWDLGAIHYPWLMPPFSDDGPNGSVEPIAKTYLLDDYLSDAKRWDIRGMVHIDAGAQASAAIDETRWLQGYADTRGLPSAIVGFAALEDPNVDALLVAHADHRAVRGIRQIVNWHAVPSRTYTARDVTQDPDWQRGFGMLSRHGLSFDLQCYPAQMAPLVPLFARHADVPVILNHAGMPVDTDEAGLALWRSGMRALAALPHVCTKLSGFGFIHRTWTVDQIRPYILEAIDIFGPDRCLFASDFPTDKLFGSFDKHLDAYHTIVAGFSKDERRDMFGRNANRIYRLALDL